MSPIHTKRRLNKKTSNQQQQQKKENLCALESCFCNSGQGGLLTVLTNQSSWTPGVCFASCQHAILLHLGLSEGKKNEIAKGIIEFQAIRLLERFYSMPFVFKSECACVYSIKLWANVWTDSSRSNKSAEWRKPYRTISKAYTWQLYIFYMLCTLCLF